MVQGDLVEQTDNSGNILASFTYDTNGTLTSVVLGNPASGPRYYYAYDAQGNVVDVTDSSGTVVASYAYDAFGAVTATENFPNGWSNPFRYDGAEGVRYDSETGLYWMSVRAYDPTLGRFISHDPLGRLAAFGLDTEPYVYAGNNPVNDTDPSGLRYIGPPGSSDGPAPLPLPQVSKTPKVVTVHINCADPDQTNTSYILGWYKLPSDTCKKYWDWKNNLPNVKQNFLNSYLIGLRNTGAGLVLGGIFGELAGLLVQGLTGTVKREFQVVGRVIDLVLMALNALNILFPTSPIASAIASIFSYVAILHTIVSTVNGWIDNPFAGILLEAAVAAIVGPEELVIKGITSLILGYLAGQLIEVSSGAMNAGWTMIEFYEFSYQTVKNESMGGFCRQFNVCGAAPQSTYTFMVTV